MNESTTRIADLPENIKLQSDNYGVSSLPPSGENAATMFDPTGLQNTYLPINIHRNPYLGGNSQNETNPSPKGHTVSLPNNLSPEQKMMLENMPSQRLPSRDINMNTDFYTQDEQIQPNYIPQSLSNTDFVRDSENLTASKIEKHQSSGYRAKMIDSMIHEFQTPILIALLYFLFQMPYLNTIVFSKFSFLNLYHSDGNINFYGLFLKSILFGISFYSLMKSVDFISDI
jgi:hypothetical protein